MRCDIRMVRVEGFLPNGECALVVFLGLCESALVVNIQFRGCSMRVRYQDGQG